jgi:hypothetical protein
MLPEKYIKKAVLAQKIGAERIFKLEGNFNNKKNVRMDNDMIITDSNVIDILFKLLFFIKRAS